MSVAVAALAAFGASQIGTPGPANMVLLASGARYGLRRSLPFVAGVALGKQIIIWPIGFGLLSLAESVPTVFLALKWLSIAYILFLAWKIAGTRIAAGSANDTPPGFLNGLFVHPLNPKAWAMITAGFTSFVEPGTSTLEATATIAALFLLIQVILHPIWCWGGQRIAALVGGTPAEAWLMRTLAVLTVLSVAFVVVT